MNQPGQLVEAVGKIAATGANLRAMSIAEANDFGILRLIVSDCDRVREALGDHYLISKTQVVAAKMDDRAGALFPILTALNEANINIVYMYAFTGSCPEQAYVVLRVNDNDKALAALDAAGFHTVCEKDFLKL